MKNLLLILGNGFSIDFINQIKRSDEIDVRNLFRLGHTVKFPDSGLPGFLSHQYCPSLWLLGARPNKANGECMEIIEEIITCSNMLFDYLNSEEDKIRIDRSRMLDDRNEQSVYTQAYFELISYLKHLFIDYNSKISDGDLESLINKKTWGWIKFFIKINCEKYQTINIITYNYDIWLERILSALHINYTICAVQPEQQNAVNIVKPHGSISFVPKSGPSPMYQIIYKIDSSGADIGQIEIAHDSLELYDKNYLIPPAGDSFRRSNDTWAAKLRECAIKAAKELNAADDVFICGMSYWHVDRKELDELLINLNRDVNITFINPDPPRELNAVLVTLFKNYRVFPSSDILGEAIKC